MDGDYNQFEVEKPRTWATRSTTSRTACRCEVVFYDGKAISVELPTTVVREIDLHRARRQGRHLGQGAEARQARHRLGTPVPRSATPATRSRSTRAPTSTSAAWRPEPAGRRGAPRRLAVACGRHGPQTPRLELRHHRAARARLEGPARQRARRSARAQARRVAAAAVRRRAPRAVAGGAFRSSTTWSASPAPASRTSTGRTSARTCPSASRASCTSGRWVRRIMVFPDCFTALGGNQYVNSSAIGNYADYLTKRAHAVRRPRVPHARRRAITAAASASPRAATARSFTA